MSAPKQRPWLSYLLPALALAYAGGYVAARGHVLKSYYTITRDAPGGGFTMSHCDLICPCFVFTGGDKAIGVFYFPAFYLDSLITRVPIVWP
jgi:hypothetical protein